MAGDALFFVAGLPVSAYGLALCLILLLLSLKTGLALAKKGWPTQLFERFLLLAIPLGLLLGRLAYVGIRLGFFLNEDSGLAFRFWQGGYSFFGVLLGFLLAAFLAARWQGRQPSGFLDALAPFGLLMLGLSRLAEGLLGLGFGEMVPEGLGFFPLALANEYGEWRFAIFLLQGALALAFALLAARYTGRPGARIRLALVLVLAFQIPLESLRADEVLSFGFVKAGQLFSAIGLFIILLIGLYGRHESAWHLPRHLAKAAFFLLILAIVGLEFLIDKSNLNINLIYLSMFACSLCLTLLLQRCAIQGKDAPPKTPLKGETP